MSKVLVTGTAGFIGYHLVNRLVREGHTVTGLDNINDYYDIRLKYDRLSEAGIVKDDIINALSKIIPKTPEGDSSAPHRIYNLGNNSPVQLTEFIRVIEKELKMKAQKIFLPMQPGDVQATWADVSSLNKLIDYYPETPIDIGIKNFVSWYRRYHSAKNHIKESSYL
jgi:nucleoside-diphosphate-sugar epimerase